VGEGWSRERVVQLGVQPAGGEQLLVGAALHDLAVVEHQDLVGVRDRREPVRDDDRGAPPEGRVECGLHERLVLGVEVTGRLVEDHDRRALEQHAGDRDPLLLSAREAIAALADDRVVSLGEPSLLWIGRRRGFRLWVACVGPRWAVVDHGSWKRCGSCAHDRRSQQRCVSVRTSRRRAPPVASYRREPAASVIFQPDGRATSLPGSTTRHMVEHLDAGERRGRDAAVGGRRRPRATPPARAHRE
jgi:hypothetical protein